MNNNLKNLLMTYEKKGYVNLGQIISKKKAKQLSKRAIDLMLGKKVYEGMFFQMEGKGGSYKKINKNSEKFLGPSKDYRKIKDLEYDHLFLKVIQNKYLKFFSKILIGNNVSSMRAMILNKPAYNSSQLDFHQDISDNWNMSGKPNFTFWMSLNGSTKQKGCLRIIEESHTYGKIGQGHFIKKKELTKFKNKKIKYLEMKAGQAIIFNNHLLHGSQKNKTSRMRLAFTVCFMNSKIKHNKYNKFYPKIFGSGALTQKKIKNLKSIPKKPYLI